MKMPRNPEEAVDIFQLLEEASEKRKREKREQLLRSVGVKEFFEDGSIQINTGICDGVECKLCIEACPTNAIYWGSGKVNVVEELCVFCTACVLNCIVDNCIKVQRKRPNEGVEKFSTPEQATKLLYRINSRKRCEIVRRRLPTAEAYLKRYLS
jgi:Fe-S-cluster-containing hydrogenase component 2